MFIMNTSQSLQVLQNTPFNNKLATYWITGTAILLLWICDKQALYGSWILLVTEFEYKLYPRTVFKTVFNNIYRGTTESMIQQYIHRNDRVYDTAIYTQERQSLWYSNIYTGTTECMIHIQNLYNPSVFYYCLLWGKQLKGIIKLTHYGSMMPWGIPQRGANDALRHHFTLLKKMNKWNKLIHKNS